MSAFVVNRLHIDALVRVALEGPADRGPKYAGDGWMFHYFYDQDGTSYDVRRETADDIGRMLWAQNLRSVQDRYPDDVSGGRPGPASFTDDEVDTYTYAPGRLLTAVEALKALGGYEYQACESPDWTTTTAYAFCQALRGYLIHALPGYDEADTWEVREEMTTR